MLYNRQHVDACVGIIRGLDVRVVLTCCQSVYTRETAKSAHLSASAAEQRSDATDRAGYPANEAGDPADEAQEDLSVIKMIGPSTRNRKDAI